MIKACEVDENSFQDDKTVIEGTPPRFKRSKAPNLHSHHEFPKLREIQNSLNIEESFDDESEALHPAMLGSHSGFPKNPEWTTSAPVQFIVSRGDFFEICQEGRDYLMAFARNHKVIVITVCGLYRTGKSYLLNLLSRRIGPSVAWQNFGLLATSGTVSACTSGIWIWASSSSSRDDDPVYMLVDCEGSGNVTNSRDHDARLFAIAMLMSSYFMYNSRGVIDETSINSLVTVTAIAASVVESNGLAQRHKPKFMWVLRDFLLALQDKLGNPISSTEYLEQSLNSRKQHKDLLIQLFSSLDCSTLVTPAADESKLQNLSEIGWNGLRPEFKAQIESLRQKIFRDSLPKRSWISGSDITGSQLLSFMETVIQRINSNDVPHIESVWKQVMAGQYDDDLYHAEAEYIKRLNQISLPMNEDHLHNLLKLYRKESLRALSRRRSSDPGETARIKTDFSSRIDILDREFVDRNRISVQESAQTLLRQLWKDEVMGPLRAVSGPLTEHIVQERLGILEQRFFGTVIGNRGITQKVWDDNIRPRREKLMLDVRQPSPVARYPSGDEDPVVRGIPIIPMRYPYRSKFSCSRSCAIM